MARRPATRASFPRPRRLRRAFLRIALTLLAVAAAWCIWVTHEINVVAQQDNAQRADAIAVFGAAEYLGRPSPVYHARLDHALALYKKQISPVVITLGGGSDRDSGKTEGGVGRDYLLANGIPTANIIAETHSIDTGEQVLKLAQIAQQHDFKRLVVVSDPTHLFRIKALCERADLAVYTSPRPPLGHIDDLDLAQRYAHEIVSYTAVRLDLSETFLHRWVEGKSED